MRHWLMKTEPESFSVDDLAAAPKHTAPWDGVRNYQARNYLREMAKGDLVFIYHSSCAEPGICGIAQVARTAYPDPTAFDRRHHHYDAKSDPETPRWFMVDVRLKRRLARPITLEKLKANQDRLKTFVVLKRGNRLSVMPVNEMDWHAVLALE
jgi:predicted RNA-binding protein with PUA-like domain